MVVAHLRKTLESRLIYSTANSLKFKLHWKKTNNEEWIHFGTGKNINFDLVHKSINEHFIGEDLFLVYQRTITGLLIEEQYQIIFKSILGNKNFFLWNKELTKAIEFNHVGLLRLGQLDKY